MMIRVYHTIFFTLLLAILCSCNQKKTLTISPISKEFNQKFLTGEGLDNRLFSTKDVMQYYEISNFYNLSPKELLVKLDDFVNTHYHLKKMDSLENLTILFYKKQLFVDYSDHLYESARDNENRTLEGYKDDLLASIEFTRWEDNRLKVTHEQVLYTNDGKYLSQKDTVSLK